MLVASGSPLDGPAVARGLPRVWFGIWRVLGVPGDVAEAEGFFRQPLHYIKTEIRIFRAGCAAIHDQRLDFVVRHGFPHPNIRPKTSPPPAQITVSAVCRAGFDTTVAFTIEANAMPRTIPANMVLSDRVIPRPPAVSSRRRPAGSRGRGASGCMPTCCPGNDQRRL